MESARATASSYAFWKEPSEVTLMITSFTAATKSSLPFAITAALPKFTSLGSNSKVARARSGLLLMRASATAESTTRAAMLPAATYMPSSGYLSSSNSSLSLSTFLMSRDCTVPFCAPTFWPAKLSLVE